MRYYKLIKLFPISDALGSIYAVNDSKDVFKKADNIVKGNIASYTSRFLFKDLENEEYFEECFCVSSDDYVLFKGDECFIDIAEGIRNTLITTGANQFSNILYYKKENIPVKELPKNWNDLKANGGYYMTCFGGTSFTGVKTTAKNVFKTDKQAKSALAFAQLSQLVSEMNGDWVASWVSYTETKFYIERCENELKKGTTSVYFQPLVFKTSELRDFSLLNHKDLWETYWQLNNNE